MPRGGQMNARGGYSASDLLEFYTTFLISALLFTLVLIARAFFHDPEKIAARAEYLKIMNKPYKKLRKDNTPGVTTGKKVLHHHEFDSRVEVDSDYGPDSKRITLPDEKIITRKVTRFSKDPALTSRAQIMVATALPQKVVKEEPNVYVIPHGKRSNFTFKIDPSILSELPEEEVKVLRNLLDRGKFIPGETKGQNGIIPIRQKPKKDKLHNYKYKFKDCSEDVRFYARPKMNASNVFIIDKKDYHKKHKR
jgi:hypothetical protein